jgi:ATP-dependent Clp protease ATP-binding subunit ClpB
MRTDRFTQKMQEGLQAAQDLASKSAHSEVDNEHLLAALLEQNEGVARPLFDKLNVQPRGIEEKLHADLGRRAKVQGGGQLGYGRELVNVLNSAEGEMAKLKDEYLSVEHYLLALADSNVAAARVLKAAGVTRQKLMQAMQQVRGSQRVTDQNTDATSPPWRARARSIP